MTAKRFIIMDNLPKGTHSNIWDKQKQHNQGIGDELWLGEVVAMLNEGVALAEENEVCKEAYNEIKSDAIHLKEENEHIKQTIKDMIQSERTEIGKMTLRHLWRQIQ